MAEESRQDTELTTADKFYISQHQSMSPEELSKVLDKPVDTVKIHLKQNGKNLKLFARPATPSGKSKGITISTPSASQAGDESPKSSKNYGRHKDAIHKPISDE